MNELVEVVGLGRKFLVALPIPRPVFRSYEVVECLHLTGHGSSRSLSLQRGIVSRVSPEEACHSCAESMALPDESASFCKFTVKPISEDKR